MYWIIDLEKKEIFKTKMIGESSTAEIYLDKDGTSEIVIECDEYGSNKDSRYSIFSQIQDVVPYYSGMLGLEVEATDQEIEIIFEIMDHTHKNHPEYFI